MHLDSSLAKLANNIDFNQMHALGGCQAHPKGAKLAKCGGIGQVPDFGFNGRGHGAIPPIKGGLLLGAKGYASNKSQQQQQQHEV